LSLVAVGTRLAGGRILEFSLPASETDDFPATCVLVFVKLESEASASLAVAALPLASWPSDEALDRPVVAFPPKICVQEANERPDWFDRTLISSPSFGFLIDFPPRK
jgi:hypothetical protein